MKKLVLKNESFNTRKGFRDWLDILGYAESTVYNTNHIRNYFTTWKNNINHIKPDNKLIKEYYNNLKLRSNERQGGGLSNAYLNKHLRHCISLPITCAKAGG